MATAAIIFGSAYLLIASGRVPHVLIALLGAMAMVLLGVLTEHEALSYVDLEVLLLLAGMMSPAEVASRTGAFDWAAIRCAQLAGGNGFRTLLLMSALTAAASAFLDNVTVVVLAVPITFSICRMLDVDPVPFLLAQIFASNIGGVSTVVADPPNIIISALNAQHHHRGLGGGRDRVRRVHAQRRAREQASVLDRARRVVALVGGLAEAGITLEIRDWMVDASDGSERNLAFLLVWFGGVTSAIIDNVPYTATMVEVVGGFPGSESAGASPLWWALALGADLGGNATVVGASANVVAINLARASGYHIGFMQFFRYGIFVSVLTLLVSTGYLWLRYYP